MKTHPADSEAGIEIPRGEAQSIDHALGTLDWRRSERMEAAMRRDPDLADEIERWRTVYGLLADVCERDPPGIDRVASIGIPRVRPEPLGRRVRRTIGPRVAPLLAPFFAGLSTPRRAALAGAAFALAAVCGVAALRANFAPALHPPAAVASSSLVLNGSVQAALAEGTRCEFVASDRMVLAEGSVWLAVKPGGRGLRVTTPYGEARVLGTQFGVTVEDGAMSVEVVEGRVAVADEDGKSVDVSAGGRVAALRDEGLGEVEARPDGSEPPAWVRTLVEQQRANWFASHFPSIGVHQSK